VPKGALPWYDKIFSNVSNNVRTALIALIVLHGNALTGDLSASFNVWNGGTPWGKVYVF